MAMKHVRGFVKFIDFKKKCIMISQKRKSAWTQSDKFLEKIQQAAWMMRVNINFRSLIVNLIPLNLEILKKLTQEEINKFQIVVNLKVFLIVFAWISL